MENLKIDLRSDELNDIMSRVPSWIVRWGPTMILLILATVLSLTIIIKTPQTITGPVNIVLNTNTKNLIKNDLNNYPLGELNIKQDYFQKVKIGQNVIIKLTGIPYQQYGFINGTITAIGDSINKVGCFTVTVSFAINNKKDLLKLMKKGMTGIGEIIVDKRNILTQFLYSD